MRIRFIYPKIQIPFKTFTMPALGLPALAALTPPEHEVAITDENVDAVNFDEPVDLVGISCMTPQAPRGYQIAAEFRKRGVPVIMGGFHCSALPDEALQHVDSVCIGEAEEIWGDVLQDAACGQLQKRYRAPRLCSLDSLPAPRLDLLKPSGYNLFNCVSATRGCPYGCEFCSVREFMGHKFRFRRIEDVVDEIRHLKETTLSPEFMFHDDNIAGDPVYAAELFNALKPLNIHWVSQASLSIAELRHDSLLKLAAESGCYYLYLGFESLSQENLNAVNKKANQTAKYDELVQRLQHYKITVHASFIFGFDHDDPEIFDRTIEFLTRNRIFRAAFCLLTPLPGTRLFERMKAENRLLHMDWEKYNMVNVVIRPKHFTPEQLQSKYYEAYAALNRAAVQYYKTVQGAGK